MVGFYRLKESQIKDFTRTLSVGCPRLAKTCFLNYIIIYNDKASIQEKQASGLKPPDKIEMILQLAFCQKFIDILIDEVMLFCRSILTHIAMCNSIQFYYFHSEVLLLLYGR